MEIIRSMTGFSWAMMLFGARQVGNLLVADLDRAAAAMGSVAESARSQLGESMDRVLSTGDAWQASAVDRIFGVAYDAAGLSLAMLEQSAQSLAALPGDGGSRREFANKVQAFTEFRYAETRLGLAGGAPLAAGLEKALALDPFRRLWAVEGLGFAHAERGWLGGREPRSLRRLGEVPAPALIPLHTGTGLLLAMRVLGATDTSGGEGPLRAALERFRTLCAAASAPGCEEMAFEGLGLAVRTLHPHLLERVDRLLAATAPELVGHFWHGVGRALYFSPSHLLPGRSARGTFEKARREPPHENGRQNALAGFAWASTLVNFRHPEVLEGLLRRHAGEIFDEPAFAGGVSSAVLLWYATNGRETHLEGLLGHRPAGPAADLWRRLVAEPAETALGSFQALEQGNELGSLFRFRASAGGEPMADRGRREYPSWSQGFDRWISRALQSMIRGDGGGDPGFGEST